MWLDFFDIKPTEVRHGELTTNIQRADLVVILLSPTSVASEWVSYEARLALEQKRRILPVILRPCRI